MKFGELMYWDIIFPNSYHSLSLKLRWKSYELRSEVVKSYFWFQEREFWLAIKIEKYLLLEWNFDGL